MAWSKVQSTHAASGTPATSRALAYGSNNGAAALLVCCPYFESATATITSVTDTAGNTWTAIGTLKRDGNNACGQIYYAKNSLAGANTVTANFSASVINGLAIAEYSGLHTTAPLRGHAEATGSSANPSSGALDVAPVAGDLLIGLVVTNAGTITAGTGYVVQEATFGWNDGAKYEDKSAVSETSVDWIVAASGWAAFGAAFQLPAAVASPDGVAALWQLGTAVASGTSAGFLPAFARGANRDVGVSGGS